MEVETPTQRTGSARKLRVVVSDPLPELRAEDSSSHQQPPEQQTMGSPAGAKRPAEEELVQEHAEPADEGEDSMIAAVYPFGHEPPEPVPQEAFEEQVREGTYIEEDTGERLPVDEVVAGMRRERETPRLSSLVGRSWAW